MIGKLVDFYFHCFHRFSVELNSNKKPVESLKSDFHRLYLDLDLVRYG